MSEILGISTIGGSTNAPGDGPAAVKAAQDGKVNEPDDGSGGETSQDTGDGTTQDPDGDGQESGWDTGVNGIKANGERGGLPVFDVTPKEFFNNMKVDRRKLVFKRGTPCQQYHRNTNYRQHFWIRNTKDGHIRKVGEPKLGGIASF